MLSVENYPVTGENLDKLDNYIAEHGTSVFVKIYPDCSFREEGTPTIYESVGTVWDNVMHYCSSFYAGGCMEVCMLEEDEEIVLFHIEEGCHYISSDASCILEV